jgi:hypothetical protein
MFSWHEFQVDHVGQQILSKLMDEWRLMDELAVLRAIYLFGSGKRFNFHGIFISF